MTTLVLHLSDIHIRTKDDPILTRYGHIVDAIKNLDSSVAAAVCILSGDITNSGSEEQFLLALDFVSNLQKSLTPHIPSGVKLGFVTIPGNHDCDLNLSTVAREVIMDNVRAEPSKLSDKSFADICLAPLERFFEFVGAIDSLPVRTTVGNNSDPRLYTEFCLQLSDGMITFGCCNTAILSQLHEQPGTLVTGTDLIPDKHPSATISIGVLHHPLHWLTPECGRIMRKKFESSFDLILTGHEHILDKREIKSGEARNTYLEGGVLQDLGDPGRSEFHVLLIDASHKKQRHIEFSWTGAQYEPLDNADPEQYHLWEELQQNARRLSETFRLTPDFAAYLENPEINLTHRVRGTLQLSDIFVYPDLKRVNLIGEKITKIVRGDLVPNFVAETPCLFLVGDDLSGKTSLGKRLFLELRSRGDVPLLVDAIEQQLTVLRCDENLERVFIKIYGDDGLNQYRQLDKSKRVVIVDNYHRLRLSAEDKIKLLEKIRTHSFRIIVLAHDLELTLLDLSGSGETSSSDHNFAYYSILPFGLQSRNRLVERWLLLSGKASQPCPKGRAIIGIKKEKTSALNFDTNRPDDRSTASPPSFVIRHSPIPAAKCPFTPQREIITTLWGATGPVQRALF